MSFVLLGILNSQAAGGAGVAYRLQTLGGTDNDVGESVAFDSANNLYVTGATRSAGGSDLDVLLAKYDTAGTVQWQRTLGGGQTDQGFALALDSTDNLYVTGRINSAGPSNDNLGLAKYDASGTIQWQKVLGGASDEEGFSIAIDSADNIYVCGATESAGSGSQDFLIVKYNSSGTVVWQKTLGGAARDDGYAIAIDSANNVYVAGFTDSAGAGDSDALLAKYNSSGSIQWQRTLGGAALDKVEGIAIDSADNVYVTGTTYSAGAGLADMLLAKYNSSGTIQWQRVLGLGSGNDQGVAVAIDSADNVYVNGYSNSTGAAGLDFMIAKYNSAGTIQWQRLLGGASTEIGEGIGIDSADNLYVIGYTVSTGAGSADLFFGVLPNDGSLTGTYVLDGVNMTYSVSSFTAATSSLTSASASLTSSNSSLTNSTSSLTSASASLTDHKVDL